LHADELSAIMRMSDPHPAADRIGEGRLQPVGKPTGHAEEWRAQMVCRRQTCVCPWRRQEYFLMVCRAWRRGWFLSKSHRCRPSVDLAGNW